MSINKLIKKQAILSLVSLALIAFIVTGSSYALFQSSTVDSNIHTVTTPNFVISYLNNSGQTLSSSDALNIDDIRQISDTDALNATDNIYRFKISNTGTIPYQFKTYLQVNPNYISGGTNNPSGTLNLLDLYYIKYETNYEAVKTLASSEGLNITDKILIFPSSSLTPNVNDVINPGQTKEFYVRIWLRNDVNLPNSVIGAETHLQLVIEGNSIPNDNVAPKGWNTSATGTLLAALKSNNPLTIPQTQIGEAPSLTTSATGTMSIPLTNLANEKIYYSSSYCKYCTNETFTNSYTISLSDTTGLQTLVGNYIQYDGKIWYVNNLAPFQGLVMFLSMVDKTQTTNESTFAGTTDSFGTSYYYRGDVTNNFVSFAGMCWRIVRIEGNGNIKLTLYNNSSASCTVTEPSNAFVSTTSTQFNTNSNDNAYVGYMYGTAGSTDYASTHTPTNDSNILTTLKTWYDTNLKTYDSYIADAVWCNDKSKGTTGKFAPYGHETSDFTSSPGYGTSLTLYAGTTRNVFSSTQTSSSLKNVSSNTSVQRFVNYNVTNAKPTLKCEIPSESNIASSFTAGQSGEGNKALNGYKIGLLTLDEVIYAGGSILRPNLNYYLMENATSGSWWTMTPAGYFKVNGSSSSSSSIFTVTSNGLLDFSSASSSYKVRPAISLKPTVKISSGDGTSSNPYVISSAS